MDDSLDALWIKLFPFSITSVSSVKTVNVNT